jgi:hemerythrin-like metal-binding protein
MSTRPDSWKDGAAYAGMDVDHRMMFELLAAIQGILENDHSLSDADPLIDRLADLTRAHCESEELLMSLYGYPHKEHHASEHQTMTERFREFCQELNRGNRANSLHRVKQIIEWRFRHVRETDGTFERYLREVSAVRRRWV